MGRGENSCHSLRDHDELAGSVPGMLEGMPGKGDLLPGRAGEESYPRGRV